MKKETDYIRRRKHVLERIGVSSTTLWRMIREERFPKPIHLGPNSRGWFESDIQKWLDNHRLSGGSHE